MSSLVDASLATHLDLSPEDAALRRFVTEHPRGQEVADPRAADLPALAQWFTYPIQSWPVLIGEAKREHLERTALGLIQLIRQVPERFFPNDPDGLVTLLGLPPGQKIAVMPPTGLFKDFGFARVDLIDDGEELRLLEANMTSTLGGWELRFWQEWVTTRPAVADFLGSLPAPPRHRDALAGKFRHLIEGARRVLGANISPINTAVVIDVTEPNDLVGSVFRPLYQQVLAELGATGQLVVTPWNGFAPGARWLEVGGVPIQVIFNHTHGISPPLVFQAFKQGRVALVNPPLHRMLGSKRVIALLSSRENDPALTAAERELVRTHIPWTRVVSAGTIEYEGRSWSLPELLVTARERFVLKAEKGTGGNAVVIGRATRPDAWREAVARALQGGWLVQQVVVSRPYLLQGADGHPTPHDGVWGAYVFGARYGGSYLRAMPSGSGDGVINGSRGASESVVFEV